MKVLETTVVVTIILKWISEKEGVKVETRLFFLYYFPCLPSPVPIPTDSPFSFPSSSSSSSSSFSCFVLPPVLVGL
jgi:hypothetical protein